MMNPVVKKIYKLKKRTGFACGETVCGDLFIGHINDGVGALDFYKNTEENLKKVLAEFDLYKSFC